MRRPLRTTLLAITAASAFALFEVFRTSVTQVVEGGQITFHVALHRVWLVWITAVLASPWCAFMAEHFPFRRGHTARTLLAHLGGAAGFTAIHFVLLLSYHALSGDRMRPPAPVLLHTYFFYVAMEMSVYFAIVLVLLWLEARREVTERAIAAARLEQTAVRARLETLQSQIRPHFLFNTLNSLAVLARRGDNAAVDRAIGDLGDLLRASFAAPAHEISLEAELAFVERYLALQRLRFPDRLGIEWDVADEARQAQVPALVLQPLVENAIEHGLTSAEGGRVRISARRAGDDLELEVVDQGPGFAGATTAASDENGDGHGVGLANTRERLTLLHGARGVLECGDLPGGGARALVRIPWRTALPAASET